MPMLNTEEIRSLCNDESIVLTAHVRDRMKKRGIQYDDLVLAVSCGEIIKQYEDDNPYPSCLILGNTADNRPLHVVVSTDGEILWFITTYYPGADKWCDKFRTRKAE